MLLLCLPKMLCCCSEAFAKSQANIPLIGMTEKNKKKPDVELSNVIDDLIPFILKKMPVGEFVAMKQSCKRIYSISNDVKMFELLENKGMAIYFQEDRSIEIAIVTREIFVFGGKPLFQILSRDEPEEAKDFLQLMESFKFEVIILTDLIGDSIKIEEKEEFILPWLEGFQFNAINLTLYLPFSLTFLNFFNPDIRLHLKLRTLEEIKWTDDRALSLNATQMDFALVVEFSDESEEILEPIQILTSFNDFRGVEVNCNYYKDPSNVISFLEALKSQNFFTSSLEVIVFEFMVIVGRTFYPGMVDFLHWLVEFEDEKIYVLQGAQNDFFMMQYLQDQEAIVFRRVKTKEELFHQVFDKIIRNFDQETEKRQPIDFSLVYEQFMEAPIDGFIQVFYGFCYDWYQNEVTALEGQEEEEEEI